MDKDENLLYVAYDSNMSHEQMKRRCPNSRFLKRARFEGYRFFYDGYSQNRKCAVANIVKSEGDVVWGALWEITKNDLDGLVL